MKIKLKSHEISFAYNLRRICRIMTKCLIGHDNDIACSVQNITTIGQLPWTFWKNEIWRDLNLTLTVRGPS